MGRDTDKVGIVVQISSTAGLVEARQRGRDLATEIGFSTSEATMIAAAISELARNIVQYAESGEITLQRGCNGMLLVIAQDRGPGIADISAALQPGYSSSGSLGLGLPGVRRIADHFEIVSDASGTTVTFGKSRL
jgi:serine/threonine-protein kinase RsbT